ncbi:hypothetical protein [Nitratifractor sp.]
MGETKLKVDIDAVCLRPDGKEISKEISTVFGKIFESCETVRSEKELFRIIEKQKSGRVLSVVDLHENVNEESALSLVDRVLSRLPSSHLLVLYDRDSEALLPRLAERGVHFLLSIPWDENIIRREFKPLLLALMRERKLLRLRRELEHCRERSRGQLQRQRETGDREELARRFERMKSFCIQQSEQLSELSDGLINLSTMMLQTELSERQKNYMSALHTHIAALSKLSQELKSRMELVRKEEENGVHDFDLNTLLDMVADSARSQIGERDVELIFDVDHTVPARIIGNAALLERSLRGLFSLLIDLVDTGEIILHISLLPSRDSAADASKSVLNFSLTVTGGRMALHKDAIEEAYRWIAKMGGDLVMNPGPKGVLLSFSVPVRKTERRSYRLPVKEWMNKRVALVIGEGALGDAMQKMLDYFHFPIVRLSQRDELERTLSHQIFEMIFVDGEMGKEALEEVISQKRDAKLVLLSEGVDTERERFGDLLVYVDALLDKPVTQERLFNTILEIFAKDTLEGTQETLAILKENLKLLAGGKKVLFVGPRDSDWMMIKGMLDGTGIGLNEVEDLQKIAMYGSGSDLVFVANIPEEASWKRMIESCDLPCRKEKMIAIFPEGEENRRELAASLGVEHLLFSPIDPEVFYRFLLERLIG